jgi:hypothetical protein
MVLIVSDNPDAERSLHRNVSLATDAGAALSDNMIIKCANGALSVEAPPECAGERLIRLPLDCLLPIEFFQLSIAGDDIVVSSSEPGLTSDCVTGVEALLELYNVTDKLARHRQISPWSLLALHPELLEHLAPRLANDLLAMGEKFRNFGNTDELILESFLHTRAYDYRENDKAPALRVLLPIIELLNHDLRGAPVQLEDEPESDGFLSINRSVPISGSGNECFAFYGPYDSFDTWMSYGFVDESAPFVRSVPMTIDLPQLGTIRLANLIQIRDQRDLPQPVIDLHLFIPKLLARKGNQIDVAALLLPGRAAPEALRRTLAFLINEWSPGHPKQRDLVLHAEERVIAANRTYYANLLASLRSVALHEAPQSVILDSFVKMCERQLGLIEDYACCAAG